VHTKCWSGSLKGRDHFGGGGKAQNIELEHLLSLWPLITVHSAEYLTPWSSCSVSVYIYVIYVSCISLWRIYLDIYLRKYIQ
jgi:hypothetical protein